MTSFKGKRLGKELLKVCLLKPAPVGGLPDLRPMHPAPAILLPNAPRLSRANHIGYYMKS